MTALPEVESASYVRSPARLAAVARTGLLDAPAEETFDGLTTLAARLLRSPMAFLTLVDDSRSFWLSACGLAADPGGAGAVPRQNTVQESFCQYVVADRAPLFVSDARVDPRTRDNPSVVLMGVRAWAGFPVMDGAGHALGSFCVMDTVERDWTGDDVEVLSALAQAASAQVQLITAMAEQQAVRSRMSEVLQRSLLTRPTSRADLAVAVRYLAAATEAHIGGDWYDAFTSTQGHTYLCVGDVAGHDRVAAAVMAQVRTLLRGLAVDSDDSPAALLGRLDRSLSALEVDALATAVVVRVDASQEGVPRSARWASAGHVPSLLRTPDGQVHVLEGPGDLLLGLDPGTERHEQEVLLPDGATLVLCSDGLVERRGEDLGTGVERLAAALAAHGNAAPEQLVDLLLTELLPEGSAEDDVVLLAVRPA